MFNLKLIEDYTYNYDTGILTFWNYLNDTFTILEGDKARFMYQKLFEFEESLT